MWTRRERLAQTTSLITRERISRASGQRYDLIMGAHAHHSIFDYRRALSPHGIYVLVGGGLVRILQGVLLGPLLSLIGSKRCVSF